MKSIKIFTRGKSVFSHIKSDIDKFIRQANLDVELKEITDVATISDENPPGLPYLTMEGCDPIYMKNGEYIHTFSSRIKSWIVKANGYGSMTRVLVPIDFSDASLNAAHYALNRYKGTYSVIELYSVHLEVIDTIGGVPVIDMKAMGLLNVKMSKIIDTLNAEEDYNNISITGKVVAGSIIPSILKEAKRVENTIIYIGSSGESGIIKSFLGSITRQLAKRTTVPLFIIPPHYNDMGTTQIALTVSEPKKDAPVFKTLYNLIGSYNPTLHLIHNEIGGDEFDYENYEELTSDFKEHLVKTKLLTPGDTVDKIVDYINTNNFDLLVMSHYQRPTLESIFHKSVAKQIVSKIKCPILIINSPMDEADENTESTIDLINESPYR